MFIQCKRDCNTEKLGDFRFSQADLKIVPYNGFENLIFKDSNGDMVSMHPEVSTGRLYTHDNRFYEDYFENISLSGLSLKIHKSGTFITHFILIQIGFMTGSLKNQRL